MKNFKRILALVLAVMMVATSVVAISAAEADEKVVYNAEAITRLNKLGIFQGYNAADMVQTITLPVLRWLSSQAVYLQVR